MRESLWRVIMPFILLMLGLLPQANAGTLWSKAVSSSYLELIVQNSDGTVFYKKAYNVGACDALTGTAIWTSQTESSTIQRIVISWDDNLVYMVGNKLVSYDKNGNLRWEHTLDAGYSFVNSIISVSPDNTSHVGVRDASGVHYLYAVNSQGQLKWKKELEGSFARVICSGASGKVFSLVSSNSYYTFQCRDTNGEVEWDYALNTQYVLRGCGFTSDDTFVVPFTSGHTLRLIGIDKNGSLKYNTVVSTDHYYGGVGIAGDASGNIFAVVQRGRNAAASVCNEVMIYSYNADGERRFVFNPSQPWVLGGVLASDGNLYGVFWPSGASYNSVYYINAQTGASGTAISNVGWLTGMPLGTPNGAYVGYYSNSGTGYNGYRAISFNTGGVSRTAAMPVPSQCNMRGNFCTNGSLTKNGGIPPVMELPASLEAEEAQVISSNDIREIESASNGKYVNLNANDYVEWNRINLAEQAQYPLTFVYAGAEDFSYQVEVNGRIVDSGDLAATATDISFVESQVLKVTLEKGINKVRIINTGSTAWNLDKIALGERCGVAVPRIINPENGPLYSKSFEYKWTHIEEATGYDVSFRDNDTGASLRQEHITDLSTLTIEDGVVTWSGWPYIKPEINYRLEVRAVTATEHSDWSLPVVFNYVIPEAPTIVLPEQGPQYSKDITYKWTHIDGATAYDVSFRDNDTGASLRQEHITDLSTVTIEDGYVTWGGWPYIKPEINYRLEVRAIRGDAVGYWSAPVVFSYVPPAAPVIIEPVSGRKKSKDDLSYKWTHIEGATAYDISFRDNDTGASLRQEHITDLSTVTIENGNVLWGGWQYVKPGINYRLEVRALKGEDVGYWSNPVVFTIIPELALTLEAEEASVISSGDIRDEQSASNGKYVHLEPNDYVEWSGVSIAEKGEFYLDITYAGDKNFMCKIEVNGEQVGHSYIEATGSLTTFKISEKYQTYLNSDGANVIRITNSGTKPWSIDKIDLIEKIRPPVIVSPVDGAVLDSAEVTYKWSKVEGATSYHVYFRNPDTGVTRWHREFTDMSEFTLNGNTVSWSGGPTIVDTYNYEFTVRSVKDSELSLWSEPVVFKYLIPGVPYIQKPLTNSVIDTATPDIWWDSIAGATGYEIRIYDYTTKELYFVKTFADLDGFVIEDGLVKWVSEYKFSEGGKYRLSVCAITEGVRSPWCRQVYVTCDLPGEWNIDASLEAEEANDILGGQIIPEATASNGEYVAFADKEQYCQWTQINIPADGTYDFYMTYASAGDFEYAIEFNGVQVKRAVLGATGGSATFVDQATPVKVTLRAGGYQVRVTNMDAAKPWSLDKIFIVEAAEEVAAASANTAPVVNAGPDQEISEDEQVTLTGLVEDDSLTASATALSTVATSSSAGMIYWNKISGPGEVVFDNVDQPETKARFSESGTYVLGLMVSDGEYTVIDKVQVIVNKKAPVETGQEDEEEEVPVTIMYGKKAVR